MIALLLSVAVVVTSLLLRGEPLVVTTIAPRLAVMLLGTFAIAVVVSVVHAVLWRSNAHRERVRR